MLGYAAIILQCLGASRFFIERRHGKVADFEQLGRSKEDHVGGVVINGIHHAALFDQDRAHSALLQLNSTGETGRSSAHHHHIEALHR